MPKGVCAMQEGVCVKHIKSTFFLKCLPHSVLLDFKFYIVLFDIFEIDEHF